MEHPMVSIFLQKNKCYSPLAAERTASVRFSGSSAEGILNEVDLRFFLLYLQDVTVKILSQKRGALG
jgi:hypothetical protein